MAKKDQYDPAKGKWIRFESDKFYNNGIDGEKCYQHGKPHFIENKSVDRWVRRGGIIIEDHEHDTDKEIVAELDRGLATDLVDAGKLDSEVDQPEQPAETNPVAPPEVVEETDEESDEEELDHAGKKTGKKQKAKKATRR